MQFVTNHLDGTELHDAFVVNARFRMCQVIRTRVMINLFLFWLIMIDVNG